MLSKEYDHCAPYHRGTFNSGHLADHCSDQHDSLSPEFNQALLSHQKRFSRGIRTFDPIFLHLIGTVIGRKQRSGELERVLGQKGNIARSRGSHLR